MTTPEDAWAPAGATDSDGNLFVVWPYSPNGICTTPGGGKLLFRWRERATGQWTPPLSTPTPGTVVSQFPPVRSLFPRGFHEYGHPSIAIDQTRANGRIYVVYADRSGCDSDSPTRIKIVWSDNRGASWSLPQEISPDSGHPSSIQVYPRVRVDGRGTVFVSWYDTRYRDSTVVPAPPGDPSIYDPDDPYYDIVIAYSYQATAGWTEQRLSGVGTQPAYFRWNIESRDYSGMTTETTVGTSNVCVLAMGRASDQSKIGIHSFNVLVRGLGDFDGDFDVDAANGGGVGSDYAGLLSCWQLAGPYPPCSPCRFVDFNADGYVDIYDFNFFFNGDPLVPADPPYTGPLCECHGPCQIDVGCLAGGAAFSGPGMMQVIDQEQPCAATARFLAVTPMEEVGRFRQFLTQRMASETDGPRRHELEYCLACLFELTE